jgi:ATP-binding cassette subfamily B protein
MSTVGRYRKMFEFIKNKNIRRFGKLMFKYKKQHFFAAFFMLINVLVTLLLPYITMEMIDKAIGKRDLKLLIGLSIFYLGVSIVQNGSKLLSDYIYSIIGKKITFDLRYKLLRHLHKLSGHYYTNSNTGELIIVLQNDISTVEEVSTKMFFSVVSDILLSIGMFIFLFRLQFDLLIIVIILQPLMMYCQSKFNKKIFEQSLSIRNTVGELFSIIQEYISNMLHYAILNARKYFFSINIPNEKRLIKENIRLEILISSSMVSMNLISNLITVGILGYGGYKVIIESMTLGGLIAFNLYSQRLLLPIMRIAQLNTKFQQSFVSINRIFGVLDEKVNVPLNNTTGGNKSIEGELKFNNVSFSYNKDTDLIKNMNMNFGSKKLTALVGASGSGKTTITNLILRLWDVDNGEILLDGVNIKEYNLTSLRKDISIVSQDVFLFNDTVLNNLTLGNSQITMDDIVRVTKDARIYDFIMTLPEKFHTKVGERGIKLSGGQKQRIAIARAILKNSKIIIFDEATSALDNISEMNIKKEISDFLKNKTAIIIAHRLSTVEDADVIYVIDSGKVVEEGNHSELMNLKNIYYNLYNKNGF